MAETIGAAIGLSAVSSAGIAGAAALPGAIGTGGAVFGGLEALAAAGIASGAPAAATGLAAALPWISAGLSATSSIFGGVMQMRAHGERAAWDRRQADAEAIKGRLQALRIREAASRDVGAALSRYGAAGIDLSSGVVGSQEDAINTMANRELQVARFNTDSAIAAAEGSSASERATGAGTLVSGIAAAFRPLSLVIASRERL